MSARRQYPETLVHALLLTEDKRFLEHMGVDLIALLRALWVCVKRRRFAQGGSTITMQLARTVAGLGNARSVRRKLAEILCALELERRLDKVSILRHYMNRVYMGPVSGFPAAARHYYGLDVSELSLLQQAALVALLPAPNRLGPGTDAGRLRQVSILDRMLGAGLITDSEHAGVMREMAGGFRCE